MSHSFIFVTIAFMILFTSVFLAPTVRAESGDGQQHKFAKGGNANDEGAKAEPDRAGIHTPDDLCKHSSCRISTDTPGFKDKFFRGHEHKSKNTSVIPQTNFATTTNGTPKANVTIPVCDGVVVGPCLDPNTHAIIP